MSHDPRDVLRICDAAIELPSAERDAFVREACAGSAELLGAVHSVLGAMDETGDGLETTPDVRRDEATNALGEGSRLGPYTLLESIGSGGMGTVFLAERRTDQFTQRVALKLVRTDGLRHPELVARFESERKILASLNHPYIARLIDGGTTETGIPYLVMEHVEGEPIDAYCDRNRLDLRARLELLRKVAIAVQAAHQNLIVHRDLKPSNVLITADGIPKLLDFGIAKPLAEAVIDDPNDQTLTRMGRQPLTPDYASPEQILEGKATMASDVYSLGVLAYQLLVGVRPYRIDSSSFKRMLESIEKVTVPRPSSLVADAGRDDSQRRAEARSTNLTRWARTLSGDLDVILLKALHRDPARRYDSVAAFSDDLKRHLDGHPIQARGDSAGYVIGRFVQRHRLAVGSTAALVVITIGALVAVSAAYIRAERARADADQRFGQVRDISTRLMFDVYDDVSQVPGTVTARQRLAKLAQEYLATLVGEGSSPDVQLDAARGYSRLSNILSRQTSADAAQTEAAEEAFQRADALLEQLTTTHSNPLPVWWQLGQLHSNRGQQKLYRAAPLDEVREHLRRSEEAFERATALAPDDPELAALRFTAQKNMADTHKWARDYASAATMLTEVSAGIDAWLERFPEQPDLLLISGQTNTLHGEALAFDDKPDGAAERYAAGLARYDELTAVGGSTFDVEAASVITHWSLANTLVDLERNAEAVESYDRSLELVNRHVARDPDDVGTQRRQVIIEGSKAVALANLGRIDAAVDVLERGTDWFETQALADDTAGAHRSVAVNFMILGNVLSDAGRNAEGCRAWRKTLSKWREIDERWGISEFDAEQPSIVEELLAECRR